DGEAEAEVRRDVGAYGRDLPDPQVEVREAADGDRVAVRDPGQGDRADGTHLGDLQIGQRIHVDIDGGEVHNVHIDGGEIGDGAVGKAQDMDIVCHASAPSSGRFPQSAGARGERQEYSRGP